MKLQSHSTKTRLDEIVYPIELPYDTGNIVLTDLLLEHKSKILAAIQAAT